MAPKKDKFVDAYLAAGYVGVMVKHPITGKVQENLLELNTYPATRPGIVKFAKDVMSGEISPEHGPDATLESLSMAAFKTRLSDKRDDAEQFVRDTLATVDESIKAAQAEALVNEWRERLDESTDQAQAADMFAERESVKARLAEIDEDIAAIKADLAAELGISKLFDLSLISTGWYITQATTSSGGKAIARKFTADVYEVERTLRGVKVRSTATITDRDFDGEPAGWHVRYEILDGDHKGNVYESSGDSLNKADNRNDDAARRVLMDELGLPGVRRSNVMVWYKVPAVKEL